MEFPTYEGKDLPEIEGIIYSNANAITELNKCAALSTYDLFEAEINGSLNYYISLRNKLISSFPLVETNLAKLGENIDNYIFVNFKNPGYLYVDSSIFKI